MPIYGKNIKQSSSPEPKCRWPWNLVCRIGCLSTINYVQIMTLGWPYFTARSNLAPYAFVLEYGKTINFSETIVGYDIKVGRCSNQMSTWSFMNIKCQGHSLIFGQGHSDSVFSNFVFLRTPRPIETRFHVELPWDGELKWVHLVYVTWPRWPPCPYMVKTFKIHVSWCFCMGCFCMGESRYSI